MALTRRQILVGASGLGALGLAGAVGRFALPPGPRFPLASVDELAVELVEALGDLDEETRAAVVVPYDHPLRQHHNRGLGTGGALVVFLPHRVRQIVADLAHAGLSERGHGRVLDQFFTSIIGVHGTHLLISGEPGRGPWQIMLSGPHLNLRVGGKNQEGIAFGGPMVYGDQRGNEEVGLPGSAYRYQLQLGQEWIAGLSAGERAKVRVAEAPPQCDVEPRGQGGRFDGIALADLAPPHRARARDFIAAILENYPDADAGYAWDCIDANGGVDAFHLADYDIDIQGGRRAGAGPSQIIRLESPSAVFHYRGEPHLHALFQVAMDAENPMSLGEPLGENPRELEGPGVKAFFERVLLDAADADFAWYAPHHVGGRIRQGTIRSGDLYNVESWYHQPSVLEVAGADVSPERKAEFASRGTPLRDGSVYRIAMDHWSAGHPDEFGFGRGRAHDTDLLLRNAAVDYARRNGFVA